MKKVLIELVMEIQDDCVNPLAEAQRFLSGATLNQPRDCKVRRFHLNTLWDITGILNCYREKEHE